MFKNIKPVLGGFLCFAIVSCKKDIVNENGTGAGSNSGKAETASYLPYNNGSKYTYSDSTTGGSSAVVSSAILVSGDTTIDGKIFSKTTTGDSPEYNYYSSADGVTTLVNYNGQDKVTTTVLKVNEPVGAVWKDEFLNAGIPTTYEWKMVAKGINRTVKGVAYSNVIQVHLDGYAEVPVRGKLVFANSDYFYAPNVGLIENISYNPKTGDIEFQRLLQKPGA